MLLDYLVTSSTRRKLLELLWRDGLSGSMRELALAGELTGSAVQGELVAMERAGLACSERVGNTRVFRADVGTPVASFIRKLVRNDDSVAVKATTYSDDMIRVRLVDYGAPLPHPKKTAGASPASFEEAMAYALRLAHVDATVARVLPVVLWRQRHVINREHLMHWARRLGETQALGFYLELVGELGHDESMRGFAQRLHDRRRKVVVDFFESGTAGRFHKELAQRNTPDIARSWNFVMNMPLESFASHFRRFAGDEL